MTMVYGTSSPVSPLALARTGNAAGRSYSQCGISRYPSMLSLRRTFRRAFA